MTQRLKPRSVAARRCAAPLALLCLIAPGAWAETVHTKRGERLVGEVIEETLAEVVLKTRYGVLTIPAEAIERVEREGAAAAEAEAEPGLSPEALEAHRAARAQLVALRLKARRSVGLGKLAEALARYQEILALDPADAAALLELGALQVRMEDPDEAVSTLRRAVLAGFTDLERLRRSDELAPLREHAGFQQLLAQRRGLVRLAARRTPDRLTRKLRERGAGSEYRVARSAEHELVYVHALDEQALAAVRAEV